MGYLRRGELEACSRDASHSASTSSRNCRDAERLHQDLDARLVDVVAPAMAVVDPQDRFEVGEQIRPRQKVADHLADHRRAAQAAAHQDFETRLALRIALQVQTDVVHFGGGAIGRRPVTAILNLRGR